MKKSIAIALSSALLLSACGGGSGSTDQGLLNIDLTDAPLDEAANVYVTIKGVSLNYEDSGWVDYDFETPAKTDLLTLQSGNTITLFPETEVDAGTYQVRLNLYSDDDNELDQYIVIAEGGSEHELTIPSGSETGLKLNSTIVVPANGTADYTIDFDVRQSVHLRGNQQNNNGYSLRPVLRLIDNTKAGSISGTITDTSLLTTDCSDGDPLTNNVIYVFDGANITPDDYGSDGAQAVTTAIVNYDDESGEYSYTTAPLLEGEYTVSLTCNSDLEDLESDNDLLFKATENKTVTTEIEGP